MKTKSDYWSFGLIQFCTAKQLNLNEVVNAFINKYQLIGDKNELAEKHWQKFASFVNSGLLDGSIKGKLVSVSNGSQEAKQANRDAYSAVDKELRDWWQYIGNSGYKHVEDAFIQKFFNCYKLGSSLPQKGIGKLSVERQRTRFEAIKHAGLLKEFYLFDPKLVSYFKPRKI